MEPSGGGNTEAPSKLPTVPLKPEEPAHREGSTEPPPKESSATAKPEGPEKPSMGRVKEGGRRTPMPDAAALQKADKQIRELFGQELAAAKTPEQKLALAEKLHQQSTGSKDEPAIRYTLLRMASTWP